MLNFAAYTWVVQLNYTKHFSLACDLLGSYMDQINQDPQKAFKIYQAACDEYKFGRSCSKVGSYYFAGKVVNRDLVRMAIFGVIFFLLLT